MIFADSITNEKIGLSIVRVKHCGKEYEGRARIHPDDEWSEFTGCRFAEMRAEIKALKDEYKKKKAACDECRKFVAAVEQYRNFTREDISARLMYRQLNKRIAEVNWLAEKISHKEFDLNVAIRQQDGFNNKIKQNKLNSIEEN